MRVKRVGFLSLLAAFAVVPQVAAQNGEDQEIRVVNNDVALANVQVSGFLNGVNKGISSTRADGVITIPASALNTVTKGTEVAVWIVTCDGVVTRVLLIRVEDEDGDNPSKHDQPDAAHAGEDCRCDRAGAFFWGDGPVTIDVGTRRVFKTPMEEIVAGEGGVSGYIQGGVQWRHFYKWEKVSGDDPSVAQHDAKSTAYGPAAYAGFKFGRLPIWGMAGGYAAYGLETNTTLTNGDRIRGEVDNYGLGAGVRWLINPDARFNPYVGISAFHQWNKGKFRISPALGGESTDERTHKSWTKEISIGGTYWMRPRVALDVGIGWNTQFDSQNADENILLGLNLTYNFGKKCGGQCGGRR